MLYQPHMLMPNFLQNIRSQPIDMVRSRVAVLAPLVELVVQLLGKSDVGDDDGVEGGGSVAGRVLGVTAGVVLVLARGAALPGHAALGNADRLLGGGSGG